MAETEALFEMDAPPPAPVEKESQTVRRTKRQAAALTRGRHPLGLLGFPLPLHAEAAPADDRSEVGRRCGNCRFREVLEYRSKSFAKCVFGATDEYAPRAAHSEATDVRSWWPACRDHEPGDPKIPDGMRWIPDPKGMR